MRALLALAFFLTLTTFATAGGGSGGHGGGSSTPVVTTPVSSGPAGAAPSASIGPYPDDGSRRMPTSNSLSAIEAGRRKRSQIIARSGRSATRLAGTPGTTPYVNTAVGGTA